VGLRLFSRWKVLQRFLPEDFIMVSAFVHSTCASIDKIIEGAFVALLTAATSFGANSIEDLDLTSPDDLSSFIIIQKVHRGVSFSWQCLFASLFPFYTSLWLVKTSFLIFYWRLCTLLIHFGAG
jgi:hypothetical protein